jgi:gag-polyprotein putative aspartyl protease
MMIWKPCFYPTYLISIILVVNFALYYDNKNVNSVLDSVFISVTKPRLKLPIVKQLQPNNAPSLLQKAQDKATVAVKMSQSALSRDDCSLVALRWQESINLLKNIPASSRQYKAAQKKLTEYRYYLAHAKLKAMPLPRKFAASDTSPQFFSVPIKGRIDGTPLVEVSLNDNQKFLMLFDTGVYGTLITNVMARKMRLIPANRKLSGLADNSVIEFPTAFVKSQRIGTLIQRDVEVLIAPPGMDTGLVGQDFFAGYNFTIKENVIEFGQQMP